MSAQNYALLSMRPRQPFDFAGRSGTISYNVDALTEGGLSWWTSLAVTDTPQAGVANSSQVLGLLPDNGVLVNFDADCNDPGHEVGVTAVYTYTNYVETDITNPNVNTNCVSTARGELNHIQVQLSQSNIAIYASPAYTGTNVPPAQLLFSTPISLNFTRGYVHFQQQERAPLKYASLFNISPGYTNNYWSDFAFDGPVVNTGEVGYSIPDALTPDPSDATQSQDLGAPNVGYAILSDPSSIDTCCHGSTPTPIAPFAVPNVNLTGVTSAMLTLDVAYTYAFGLTTSNVALQYSVNGGPWLNPSSQPNYPAEQVCSSCPGPEGGDGVPYAFSVPVADLVQGTNTVTFRVVNGIDSYPPVLTSVDLLSFTGSGPL